jgi:DNA/RNA endonuclease G (NUC1)
MSNVVPQLQALNGGPWENLESRIANDYSENLEEVWVLTGPTFNETVETLAAGVEFPDQFYMIVIDEENGQARTLAFIMNEDTHSPAKLEGSLVRIDARDHRPSLFHGEVARRSDPGANCERTKSSGPKPQRTSRPTAGRRCHSRMRVNF